MTKPYTTYNDNYKFYLFIDGVKINSFETNHIKDFLNILGENLLENEIDDLIEVMYSEYDNNDKISLTNILTENMYVMEGNLSDGEKFLIIGAKKYV